MQTLYLAGPMRGYPEYNFPAFDSAAENLRKFGFRVISPADLDRAHGFSADDEVTPSMLGRFLRRDIDALTDCDAIVLLPGWSDSLGASAEKAVARAIGIKVYCYTPHTPGADILVSYHG